MSEELTTWHLVDYGDQADPPPVIDAGRFCKVTLELDQPRDGSWSREHIWIEADALGQDGRPIGQLRNHPVVVYELRYGDRVSFERANVLEWMDDQS